MSRRGAAHIKLNMPCQDYSLCDAYKGCFIAVVSDGHGNKRHYLSDRGSRIACEVAIEEIKGFLDNYNNHDISDISDEIFKKLKESICINWRKRVVQDFRYEGRSVSKDNTGYANDTVEIAYGCTLCAAFTATWGWAAIQVGDGCIAVAEKSGNFDWPIPESEINEGNLTASLCLEDPMIDFRHVYKNDFPVGIFVYSDGIEKVLPNQGKDIISFLDWVVRNDKLNIDKRDENLKKTLDMFSAKSRIGDDVSVACIYDNGAEDVKPQYEEADKKSEIKQLTAKAEELRSTIEYNDQLFKSLSMYDSEKAKDIDMLIKKRKNELIDIEMKIAELEQ
jgi:hypothetical protein